VQVKPMAVDGHWVVGVHVALPKTNLLAIATDIGYIMCGALDIRLLNERLADRGIVAGRAVGVRNLEELLQAPLESTTTEAAKHGIVAGMTGRQAIHKMMTFARK
jgi:uncharacterized protein YunC (DUF1805 family)